MSRIRAGETLIAVLAVGLLSVGCMRHEIHSQSEVSVAPLEVKPIHITIDVNIKVDRALDDFFSDIDKASNQTK